MEKTMQQFLEELKNAGMSWQLNISKTTELSTRMYFQTFRELSNFLDTFFTEEEANKIIYTDGIAVVKGVQYTLYSV